MQQTTNVKLNLPEYTDPVDIEQLNDNFKAIDEQLADVFKKPSKDGSAGQVLTKTSEGCAWGDAPRTVSPATGIPRMDGVGAAGTTEEYARGDHIHPTDTSRQGKITAEGILQSDGNGNVTAADTVETNIISLPVGILKATATSIETATAGTDYMAPIPVTTADNGKFLRVVDGAWAAAAVADASGVSF